MQRALVKVNKREFRGKFFVAGYHGIGLVGYLAVRHIVRALGGRKIGYVISKYMPQVVEAAADGVTTPYELYSVGQAVVFLPNYPLSRGDLLSVPYALAEASVEGGVGMAVLIGGLDSRYRGEGGSRIRYAATGAFLHSYGKLMSGESPLEEELSIVGPLAAMLAYYEAVDYPAVAILPYADSSTADPLAASAAVEYVSRITGVPVDINELLKLAEERAKLRRELEEKRRRAQREEREARVSTLYV